VRRNDQALEKFDAKIRLRKLIEKFDYVQVFEKSLLIYNDVLFPDMPLQDRLKGVA